MPQVRATGAQAPDDAESTSAGRAETSREQLARLLNPLDLVILSRERIQEAVDDAVQRGRMTRTDASNLAADLVRRSRRQTDDLLADIEQLLGRSRDQITAPAERVRREVDRARRAAGGGSSFPIAGYDELTAAKVTERLAGLTPAELRKIRDHERRNANRKTVLAAVERRLG